jgi:multidrug efflux system outer membrane protein
VARVQTELAATEADALALDRQRARLEHALAVLVGEPPPASALQAAAGPRRCPSIPAGVPARCWRAGPTSPRRRSALLAAQARVGVAQQRPGSRHRAHRGRRLCLAGPGRPVQVVGAGLGRRRAAVAAADSTAAGARRCVQGARRSRRRAGGYRGQVLVAFREVEDQLSSRCSPDGRASSRRRRRCRRARARAPVRCRKRAIRNGLVSQLELLDARRSELRNRRQALQVRSAQYQATVGWSARWVAAGKRDLRQLRDGAGHHQRRRQELADHGAVPLVCAPGPEGGAVQGAEHEQQRPRVVHAGRRRRPPRDRQRASTSRPWPRVPCPMCA